MLMLEKSDKLVTPKLKHVIFKLKVEVQTMANIRYFCQTTTFVMYLFMSRSCFNNTQNLSTFLWMLGAAYTSNAASKDKVLK